MPRQSYTRLKVTTVQFWFCLIIKQGLLSFLPKYQPAAFWIREYCKKQANGWSIFINTVLLFKVLLQSYPIFTTLCLIYSDYDSLSHFLSAAFAPPFWRLSFASRPVRLHCPIQAYSAVPSHRLIYKTQPRLTLLYINHPREALWNEDRTYFKKKRKSRFFSHYSSSLPTP